MFALLRRLIHPDEDDDADRPGPLGDPASTPPSSSTVPDKPQKLDPSAIEFEEDAPEIHGGYATVSRAFLVSTSSTEARAGHNNQSHDGATTRKPVAVKKLKIEIGKDKTQVLGLALREAQFFTDLSHENIIKLEGFVEDLSQDKVWLIFPWAANGDLKKFVASKEWEIPERISLMNDVTGGVEYLHNWNPPIYHGDLKSANVLVISNYRAVITDFGSARRFAEKDSTVQPDERENEAQPALVLETELCEAAHVITLTGNKYTLRWAAPELLMYDNPGLWSDIWALGWIFYEVMTNVIPFHNVQNDLTVIAHVIHGNLPSVDDHASMELIRALYSLMTACWSINPSKRPTAEDCRKSMSWMASVAGFWPMLVPDPQRASNTSDTQARSPKLLIQLGHMHRNQNDYTNASKFLTEALGICTETADNAGKADALFGLAEVNRGQNNYSEAVTFYSEVVQICTEIGNRQRKADALCGLAEVHRLRTEYSQAITSYSEVVRISTETGDRIRKANALRGIAHVHLAQNKYEEAASRFSEVIQICTDVGDRQGKADALWGLAEVHRVQKQYDQAVQLFSESMQVCIDVGDRDGRAWALMCLADVHRDQDRYGDAASLYEQAAGIFEEIGDTRNAADALSRAAHVRQQLGPSEAE